MTRDQFWNPETLRSTRPRSKPCLVCARPIVKRYPSQLAAVKIHRHCKGAYNTLAADERRCARLEPFLTGRTAAERRAYLDGYARRAAEVTR